MTDLRILIADDHTLVRAGFRSLLESLPGCCVVAEVGDGREALRLVAQLQPDVVLMDVKMPSLNGLEATARISRDYPNVRVVILSMYTNEEYVLQALRAGAVGYLLKDAATAELQLAIQAAVRGEMYLSPSISKRVLQDYIQLIGNGGGMLDALTPRQREVLQLIAEGRTMKEIAQSLQISVKTAESHRTQLMERLDIHDVTGLVRFAIRVGLVTPE
ncbi:MAG: DNA-binding response regulator [Candidatus Viridilinea halotolerans]|uniref:DNA-binding response regulator n=1 Tax=Candidatus Viridilinea halotolerans TaxID=2491704 RepID=A0A426U823_9CHLR|nr:MAG: DNA-binding response regulator [Candidatus Viridilinea halotolerans]